MKQHLKSIIKAVFWTIDCFAAVITVLVIFVPLIIIGEIKALKEWARSEDKPKAKAEPEEDAKVRKLRGYPPGTPWDLTI